MLFPKLDQSLFSPQFSLEAFDACSERNKGGLRLGASKSESTRFWCNSEQSSFDRYLPIKKRCDLKFFGLDRRRTEIRKFEEKPFEERLSWCVDKINESSLLIRKPGPLMGILYGLTQERPDCIKATLWLAILRRICGLNPSKEFLSVLKQDPQNRKALLNLCVIPLTCSDYTLEPSEHDSFHDALHDALSRIKKYLIHFPKDPFARLIECQLLNEIPAAEETMWEKLSSLYLDNPDYSAVLSSMAVFCTLHTQKTSAEDFAREAFQKCSDNWQAALLLRRYGIEDVTLKVEKNKKSFSLNGEVLPVACMDTIFLSPYSIQDPLWSSD